MILQRRQLVLIAVVAVGVLAALLKFLPLILSTLMTSSSTTITPQDGSAPAAAQSTFGTCAHKRCSKLPAAFLDRDILPTDVQPTHYNLVITPDMTAFTFDGHVTIQYAPRNDRLRARPAQPSPRACMVVPSNARGATTAFNVLQTRHSRGRLHDQP